MYLYYAGFGRMSTFSVLSAELKHEINIFPNFLFTIVTSLKEKRNLNGLY